MKEIERHIMDRRIIVLFRYSIDLLFFKDIYFAEIIIESY